MKEISDMDPAGIAKRKELLQGLIDTITFVRESMAEARNLRILYSEGVLEIVRAHKHQIVAGKNVPESWKIAAEEIQTDHPRISAQSVVMTWSMFEVSIEDMMVTWLRLHSELLSDEPIKNLKLPVDTLTLDPDEQMRRILRSLKNETYRQVDVVEKLESIWKALKLKSGTPPEDVRKNLIELFHVRGILVHRRGLIDRDFIRHCPWIKLPVGSRIVVTSEMANRYADAADKYAHLVIDRLNEAAGLPTRARPVKPNRT